MAVFTPIPATPTTPATAPAMSPGSPEVEAAKAAGPACPLQRSASLWQLGIEAQELTTTISQLAEQLDTDEEEIRRQALAAKADATCWVIEHLRAQAAYRQQQARRLSDLSRSDARRADCLESSLVLVLTHLQPQASRFSFPNHELSSRSCQAVEIEDEEALGSQWLSVRTTSQPDKAAIRRALKAGRQIPGAQLRSRRSWRIH